MLDPKEHGSSMLPPLREGKREGKFTDAHCSPASQPSPLKKKN
jgi:hypothetical protein